MFLGKMDPKTGKVTQYPIPVVKQGWPLGTLNLEIDKDDNPWVGVMYQSAIAKFDKKTEKFTDVVRRPRSGTPPAASSAIWRSRARRSTTRSGSRIPTAPTSIGSISSTNKFENLGAPKDPRTGKQIGTYGLHSDSRTTSICSTSRPATSSRSTPRPRSRPST